MAHGLRGTICKPISGYAGQITNNIVGVFLPISIAIRVAKACIGFGEHLKESPPLEDKPSHHCGEYSLLGEGAMF